MLAFTRKLSRDLIQEDANRADQVKMKLLLATITDISIIVEGTFLFSIADILKLKPGQLFS